eukprot:gene12282-16591_t
MYLLINDEGHNGTHAVRMLAAKAQAPAAKGTGRGGSPTAGSSGLPAFPVKIEGSGAAAAGAAAAPGAASRQLTEMELSSHRHPFLDKYIPVRHCVTLTATPVCFPEAETAQLSFDRDFGPFADCVTLAEATRRGTIAPWTLDVLVTEAPGSARDADEDGGGARNEDEAYQQMFARALRRVFELTEGDPSPKCLSFHDDNDEAFMFSEY